MATLHLVSGGTAPTRPAAPRDPRGGSARSGSPAGGGPAGGGPAPRARVGAVRPVGPRTPPPLRLTRRGRIVVRIGVALLVVIGALAAVLLAVRPAMAGTRVQPVPVRHHVVMPGETLLELAAEEVPGVDPRDTAARIRKLNALADSRLVAGQELALPLGS